MSNIPKVTVNNSKLYKASMNYSGELCNQYSPLLNLIDSKTNKFKDFTTLKLLFDLTHPVDILVLESYDGSVNLILNDDKTPPKLINSRFSIQENNTFLIPDHRGYKDTNTYNEDTFDIDTALKPIPLNIPKVSFDGLFENQGNLKCGSYTFYFKLSDADGNESEVMAESGVVLIHIGTPNKPNECRMGLEDENSKKSIQFTISNIDSGFDYIHVLYARSSSGSDLASVETCHKINFNYPVLSGLCIIVITGNENISEVEKKELYVNFADIQSVKTQTEAANVLMFGNISKPYHDYDALQRMSWKIIPYEYIPEEDDFIGHINSDYKDSGTLNNEDSRMCYYNSKNVYYRLGYWPDEIYRFGIVYIFNDNSLSPVFNILGVDFSQVTEDLKSIYPLLFFENGVSLWECEPENYYFNTLINTNGKVIDVSSLKLNSKGVVKFSKQNTLPNYRDGVMQPKPVGIKFDFSLIHKELYNKPTNKNLFKEHNIKGFFFVRQKRVPTILGQGVAIGVTHKDHGSIPVILNAFGQYIAEAFLDSERLLLEKGTLVTIPSDNVKIRGLLMPDAEICTGVYNDIFVGNEFCLEKATQYYFKLLTDRSFIYDYQNNDNKETSYVTTLLNIPEDTTIISDGTDYFSTVSGNASEAYKTIDVKHPWNHTPPLTLTESTSLVRGKFGAFVGVGSPTKDDKYPFKYGEVYNIKEKRYAEDSERATLLDFLARFNNFSEYKAICDRTEVTNSNIICYRGDCFQSIFTHRMNRNFIDPELPTNRTIIDPSCWAANYGVRCTAAILTDAHSNLVDDSSGWVIPAPQDQPWVQALIYFLTGNIIGAIKELTKDPPDITPEKMGITDYKYKNGLYYVSRSTGYNSTTGDAEFAWVPWSEEEAYPNGYANEIVQAFEVYTGNDKKGAYLKAAQKKKKVNPKEQESAGGINLKAIFKSDENWDLRGLASINRADVNAVGLGHWITFPILSNRNLAFRDIDYSNTTEQASFNRKRSFYPLQAMDKHNPLRDSNVINAATSVSIPHKPYFGITDYRFLKQEYFTRVFNSITDSANSYNNEYKQILESLYLDYTKQCGSITKIIAVNNIIYVIFEHGIGYVTFKPTHSGVSPEMMQDVILLTDTYGSIWKDSIIDANGVIYGVDSVAKKIWMIANNQFKIISDFTVLKFLIDNLDMSEFTTTPYIGHINIKTHFNAYKNDVIFTYYNDKPIYDKDGVTIKSWEKGLSWALCYNQVLDKFITFYDWCPIESVNIDNIYFSFDRDRLNILTELNKNNLKAIVNMKESDDYYWEDVQAYEEKKFLLDEAFNHTISVYDLTNTSSITPKPLSKVFKSAKVNDDYIVSFYYRGYINITKSNTLIRWPEDQDIYKPSDTWKHVTMVIPNCNKNSSYITFTSALDKSSIAEISICPISEFKEIEDWYKKTYTNNSNKYPALFDEKQCSKLLSYELKNTQDQMFLWKHGLAGVYDIQGEIKPTMWYNKQYPFSFEFIVNETSSILKIFNNLKIISNKTEPCRFEYEIVGEGYEWFELKPVIKWINDKASKSETLEFWYKEVLSNTYNDLVLKYIDFPKLDKDPTYVIPKLLYLDFTHEHSLVEPTKDKDLEHTHNSSHTTLVYDKRQNDFNVHTVLIGNNIKKVGRAKGNMLYLEDLWDIEIRPVAFKYVYLDNDELKYTTQKETRHRDKYLKVKVCYSGEDLAVIQAILTTFEISYA